MTCGINEACAIVFRIFCCMWIMRYLEWWKLDKVSFSRSFYRSFMSDQIINKCVCLWVSVLLEFQYGQNCLHIEIYSFTDMSIAFNQIHIAQHTFTFTKTIYFMHDVVDFFFINSSSDDFSTTCTHYNLSCMIELHEHYLLLLKRRSPNFSSSLRICVFLLKRNNLRLANFPCVYFHFSIELIKSEHFWPDCERKTQQNCRIQHANLQNFRQFNHILLVFFFSNHVKFSKKNSI